MKHIEKIFNGLTLLFGRKVGEAEEERLLRAMYVSILSDLSPAELVDAAREYCRRGRFFPKPAELIEAAERVRGQEPPDRTPALPQFTSADLEENQERARANIARIKELLNRSCLTDHSPL
jgi:hypothetical protein